MGPDLEKAKVEIGALTRKDNGSVTHNQEDNLVQCMSNYEDNNFHEEVMNDSLGKMRAETEDVEVNIVECTKSGENGQVEEGRYEDCTESNSSFGDTLSEDENGPVQDDMEVESRLSFDGAPAPGWAFDDDYGGEFPKRRKKLTDHWRRFIRPIMWRCKWIELQIKSLQSQAQKYDRELAQYAERKLFDFVEGCDTKSLPFSSCTRRKKVVKRKKRKRVEEMTDVASHMLQHNLFSYYENRDSAVGGGLINNNCSNLDKATNAPDEFGLQDEWPSFDCKGDVHENLLRKIEVLQSQVRTLKARMEKVERENPEKFSCLNRLSEPETYDMLTNSDQDPASPPENRDQRTVRSKNTLPRTRSHSNMGDVLPESAVSSHGEVIPVSDMIESMTKPQTGVSGKNTRKGILKDKMVVKEEMQDLKATGSQPVEKNQEVVEKKIVEASADEMATETLAAARVNFGGKTLPKNRSNITNKRSRGRRKSARGGWSRKK
ncbi:uncharacterized protein [Euphorbia lathyris]|uniref:uncharacterized protein n=1 Tax=Euphorbia lathyris TaxID=212925 RepID=UPI0033139FA5